MPLINYIAKSIPEMEQPVLGDPYWDQKSLF